jgi:hypothetical protein
MIRIFGDFCQFSAKKLAFFLKNQCYDQILAKSSSSLSKKTPNIFANFFGENIIKDHKIGRRRLCQDFKNIFAAKIGEIVEGDFDSNNLPTAI